MKEINDSDLNNVVGGETYLDGICSVCGKKFADSNNLEYKYLGNSCQAKTKKFYCDSCGGEVDFQRVVGDGSK